MKLFWLTTFAGSLACVTFVCPTAEGTNDPSAHRLRKVKGESARSHLHDGRRLVGKEELDYEFFEVGGVKKGKKCKKKKKQTGEVCSEDPEDPVSVDCLTTTSMAALYTFCDSFLVQADKCCTADTAAGVGAVGVGACSGLAGTFTICKGSCKGVDACKNTGGSTGTTSIGIGSCSGLGSACEDLGDLSSSLTVEANSCTVKQSCNQMAKTTPGTVTIGTGSCRGLTACGSLGLVSTQAVSVGAGSCLLEEGCSELGVGTLGPVSVGNSACKTSTTACKTCQAQDPPNSGTVYTGTIAPIADDAEVCPVIPK